jgi:hypothetical protein
MIEQIVKKKRKENLIMMSYESIDKNEVISTLAEIRTKILKVMRYHIGEENSITPVELFTEIFRINPAMFDLYKREFLWRTIQNVIRQMKKAGDIFIINKRVKLFVLKSEQELSWYKNQINFTIRNLLNSKKRAKKWVSQEKWRGL